MEKRAPLTEKLLMLAMALFFVLPLPCTIYFSRQPLVPGWATMLANRTLLGVKGGGATPFFSKHNYFHAIYQRDVADYFNSNFTGRELAIRLLAEFDYRVLKMCSINSISVAIGRNDVLYQDGYLQEYCLQRIAKETLAPRVAEVKKLQEECEKRGCAFVLLITPSKASIYPEDIPPLYAKSYIPLPRGYDQLVELLKEQGVHYVDGHALTMEAKAKSPVPVFPKGGTHWGAYAALMASNALLEELRAQGLDQLHPIKVAKVVTTGVHTGDEDDIVEIMNLMLPWDYPVGEFHIKKSPVKPKYNMVVVGGSFIWRVVQSLSKSGQFSEIIAYYYWREGKFLIDGEASMIQKPVGKVNFEREIYAADCLVMEVNEHLIPTDVSDLSTFLPEALANLPPAGKQRAVYLSSLIQPYEWGQGLSFGVSGPDEVKSTSLKGFSHLEAQFTWTDGQDAGIRLELPPADRDIALEVVAGAYFDRRKFREQNVTVSVNGTVVGEWKFPLLLDGKRRLVIPAKLLAAGGVSTLGFHIEHPVSPKETGLSDDPRLLGLKISTMRLAPVDGNGDAPQDGIKN